MCFGHFIGLVVQDHEVAVLEVEAVQLVAGTLCIHDIFVDDESGSLGICRDSLADLTEKKLVLALSRVVRRAAAEASGVEDGIAFVPDRPKFAKKIEEFLTTEGVSILL